jgi:DNA-directed RNA polymerase specialized sigma subunit
MNLIPTVKKRGRPRIDELTDAVMTQAEVAREMGVSRSYIHLIERSAIRKLRSALKKQGITSVEDVCP